MSGRPGSFQLTSAVAAAVLGGATGLTFSLGNTQLGLLIAAALQYVATATVGTRQPTFRVLTGSTILWQGAAGTFTAGQTGRIMVGSGVAVASVTTPLTLYMPLPVEFIVPLGASLQVFDSATIDNNDTVALTSAVMAM